jgi:two-component system sensor histidine kinase TctE
MSVEQPLLRRQLLTWLLVPLTALLTVDAFVSYWVALSFSRRAYDRSLIEIAREVSLHLKPGDGRPQLDLPAAARQVLLSDPSDRIYFEVSAIDGEVVAGETIPARRRLADSATRQEALYDGMMNGSPVRIVELRVAEERSPRKSAAVVRVAETEVKRNELAREILLSVVAPQILLILIAAAVVWFGIVRGLAPLSGLQRSIASRLERDLSPLRVEQLPGEIQPLLEAINGLLARLDGMLTLQSRFIADAAHQLKTPMAGFSAQLELALREQDPARMRKSLEQLLAEIERLTRLMNQMLSLARNEPDAASSLSLHRLDLHALALDVATSWVPEALKRRIDLGFEADCETACIDGDPVRLRELLDNLLDNAVRYSREDGHITVRVAAAPRPVVSVSDDGPAIPVAERRRVFERFHRLLGSPQGGSGLGLAIAWEIARLHRAEIRLDDDIDGIGNTFSVSFPPPRTDPDPGAQRHVPFM